MIELSIRVTQMSDENKNFLSPNLDDGRPTTDFSPKDLGRVEAYKQSGLPGISEIEPSLVAKMAELYVSGKTYGQISNITRTSKDIVMYLAHRFDWYKAKQQYIVELEELMDIRVYEAKLMSQDFMLQLQQFFERKIGKNINRFLNTGNDDVANEVNLKDIATYLKTLEALGKSLNGHRMSDNNTPAVGLNLGEGVTVTKKSDNTVEITPKAKAVGDILKQFADSRREEEKK